MEIIYLTKDLTSDGKINKIHFNKTSLNKAKQKITSPRIVAFNVRLKRGKLFQI